MSNRVRFVTYAWGDKYISDLLNLTIPALLAPGNLPCLVEGFDCDFVLLSQTEKFDSIRAHPAFQRLSSLCTTRLVSLDDLTVGPWYGISLTFALHRGIADLGPAMVDTFCVFLNADFILADGSLRAMAQKMKAGERLIVAPSYCVIAEEVLPLLRAQRDNERMELRFTPREMAAIALKHRHYTIQAKTVNQQVFRGHRHDQFYWCVDDLTLLGRQLPIAVVCMKPERHLTTMRTYWDYGLISDACPETVPCVLGDSDDFLMIELRGEDTYMEFISLGWPTQQEIAADLSSFTTKDHHDYGRFPLVLHAADLPPDMASESAKFDAYMNDLYALLSPPVDYVNHKFWTDAIDLFLGLRANYLRENGRSSEIGEINGYKVEGTQPGPRANIWARPTWSWPARWRDWFSARQLRAMALRAYSAFIGSVPHLNRNHPLWTDLDRALEHVREVQARPGSRVLVIRSENNLFRAVVDGKQVRAEEIHLDDVLMPPAPPEPLEILRADSGFREVGDYGDVRLWAERPAKTRTKNSLILTSDSEMMIQLRPDSGPGATFLTSSATITVSGLAATVGPERPPGLGRIAAKAFESDPADQADEAIYDLCLCDLNEDELANFKRIYASVRPRMRTGGKVVALFLNRNFRVFDARDAALIMKAFPRSDVSRLHFQGSAWTRLARRFFRRGVRVVSRPGIVSRVAGAGFLFVGFALAGVVNRRRPKPVGDGFLPHASSLLLEVTVKRSATAQGPGADGDPEVSRSGERGLERATVAAEPVASGHD